jgi:hypothetical protein
MPEIGQLWWGGCVPYKQSIMVMGVCPLEASAVVNGVCPLQVIGHGDGVCLEGVEVRK